MSVHSCRFQVSDIPIDLVSNDKFENRTHVFLFKYDTKSLVRSIHNVIVTTRNANERPSALKTDQK